MMEFHCGFDDNVTNQIIRIFNLGNGFICSVLLSFRFVFLPIAITN